MSKVIEAIKEVQLNKLAKKVPINYASFEECWDTDRSYGRDLKTYAFRAVLGTKIELSEDFIVMSKGEILTECLKSTRHLVAEEIFGEFRAPLLSIRLRAASRGDYETVKEVETILDSMFKV